MSELERQMAEARAHVDVRWDERRAQKVAAGFDAFRRRERARRTAAALLVLAIAAGGGWWWRNRAAAPPSFAREQPRPSQSLPSLVRFADGSIARPLDAESVVRSTSAPTATRRVTAEVVHGGARFDVVHDPSRVFHIDAGQVSVEVLGTAFTVERRGAKVRVAVEHGRVRVSWAHERRELVDGQAALFPPDPPSSEWKTLADRGDYPGAWAALRDSELRDEPGELLLAADVARLSHHPAEALPRLEQILQQHGTDPRASLAAFTLGRVLLEELDRPRDAALAFADARRRDADGPLAADALAREVEAWSRAGEPVKARDRADEYVRKYPEGIRMGSVRRYGAPMSR
jgi:hypothetical protein